MPRSRCCTRRPGGTLAAVPTTRPRHVITESDELAAALDHAARRWPEDAGSRARLLLRLVEEGHRAVVDRDEQDRRRRLEALADTSGALTGCYPSGYIEELRKDWPE